MFTHNRKNIDLNGTWNFIPDPMQRCRRQSWWKNPTNPNKAFPCWDEKGMWETRVPSTWKVEHEELKWYDGHAVYMRDFNCEIPEDHEAFLVFDGTLYSTEVYLNGQLAGDHKWGYSPFQIRVTDLLKKNNRLWVLLENVPRMDRVPGEIQDWCNDGGIIHPVKLIFVPRTYIENFKVETKLENDQVEISVSLQLESRDSEACEEVSIEIPELGLKETVSIGAGEKQSCCFKMEKSELSLWSPDNPKLYDIKLSTRHEVLTDEIGLREIKTVGREIILNGEAIRLYGISTHAEFKGRGRSANDAGIALIIEHAKELGCNFLRCAHYPFPEAWGRALDKAGIMWWQEVPAYWLPDMHSAAQTERACGMMREAALRDWNRSSLIIWSVSNECCYQNPEKPEQNNYPYWFAAVKQLRDLDPTRLLSCAEAGAMISVKPVWNPNNADEFDRAVEDVESWRPGHIDEWYKLFDILAANLYVERGQSEATYRRFAEMFRPYNKPLMLSEFGSMSLRNSDAPDDMLGSEANHAAIFQEAYDVIADLPEIVATSPWCLADIRVPLHWRWYNEGKGVFRYGICDENYEKKVTVYDTLRVCISKLKQS